MSSLVPVWDYMTPPIYNNNYDNNYNYNNNNNIVFEYNQITVIELRLATYV